MKRYFSGLLIFALFVTGCVDSGDGDDGEGIGKGGRVYGGVFKISENDRVASLYPPSIISVGASNIAVQIYENLLKFSPKDLSIVGGLAEKWVIDPNGKKYTFTLREDLRFQDDACFPDGKGRDITTKDVQYAFELLCTQSPENVNFNATLMDQLKGANEYYAASANGKPDFPLEGVKIIDDRTIEIYLEKPFSSFKYVIAHPALAIVAQESVEKYGKKICVGAGPFKIASDKKINIDNIIYLVRNENYFGVDSFGNQLPFIDTISIAIIDSKKTELEEFKNGNLDVVNGLPSESIREIVEQQIASFQENPPRFLLDRSPEMGTQYYSFNMAKEVFKDVRVRQAFNYAVNRQKIIDQVLKGEAFGPGEFGVSPPSFKGYNIREIKGYTFDIEKAKQLLAEAGYPNGAGFPTVKLELNSGGYKNTSVAFEVQKQLMDHLNINIDLEVVPFAQKLVDEQYGRADIFRTAWVSDYPSPQNFLMLFYGKNVPESLDKPSYPNSSRYVSSVFDELYEKGIEAITLEESYKYLLQAEKVLMEDAPIIVLWYQEDYKLIQSDIRNYYTNPMKYRDCREIFFKELGHAPTQRGQ